MMRRRRYSSLIIVALLVSASAFARQDSSGHFGSAFTDAKAIPLSEVMSNLDKYAGKTIKVEGDIHDVCQAKGCWMVVTDGEREMRVTFKDYGFFVPKDSSGKKAIIEGTVSKKTISEMHAQHLAQESKKKTDPSAIKGPQEVITMVATGVQISGQ